MVSGKTGFTDGRTTCDDKIALLCSSTKQSYKGTTRVIHCKWNYHVRPGPSFQDALVTGQHRSFFSIIFRNMPDNSEWTFFLYFVILDGCEDGWYQSNVTGNCYRVSTSELDWWESQASCQTNGSQLLILETREEEESISHLWYAQLRTTKNLMYLTRPVRVNDLS